jgi:hypothetical protein
MVEHVSLYQISPKMNKYAGYGPYDMGIGCSKGEYVAAA